MELAGEIINNALLFGLFIYLKLLLHGKIKLSNERQAKLDALIQHRGTLLKIIINGGTLVFGLLLLIGLLNL